jgi:hypothetical protein
MRKRKILELYDLMRTDGEVGIEIEMEGKGLMRAQEWGVGKYRNEWPWAFKADGSLRGESCEWVLLKPVPRTRVNEVLGMLWEAKEQVKAEFTPSRRCGVHIHMNVQQMTEQQVWNLLGTYIAFENILVRWAGEDREGNLFCLRATDAYELIDAFAQARQKQALHAVMNDGIRYASININSIARYGSVEFRSLGTPTDPQRISQWVRMLWCVRDASEEVKDLRDLLYRFSANDARELVLRVFGQRSVLRHLDNLDEMIKDGMRHLQDMLIVQPSKMRDLPPMMAGEGWWIGNAPPPRERGQVRLADPRWAVRPNAPQPVDPLAFFNDEPDFDGPDQDDEEDPE